MKARIKATGEIYGVVSSEEGMWYRLEDGHVYPVNELDFIFDNKPDWQHYRIQAAIAAMQTVDDHVSTVEELAKRCVRYADALIAELQKKGGKQ